MRDTQLDFISGCVVTKCIGYNLSFDERKQFYHFVLSSFANQLSNKATTTSASTESWHRARVFE